MDIGVCGYPSEMKTLGYPQAHIFRPFDLKNLSLKQKNKVIEFDQVQTTPGYIGSPIFLRKFED